MVSWGTYAIFVKLCGLTILIGNILSWICAFLFAFFTNKVFVFRSKSWEVKLTLKEFTSFLATRTFTGLLEVLGVPFLVKLGLNQTLFGIKGMLSKIIVSLFVVVFNYIINRLFIFDRRKPETFGDF
jgi:putative flippase GtrA